MIRGLCFLNQLSSKPQEKKSSVFGVTKAEALLSQTQSDDYNRCLLFSSQYDAAVCVLFFFSWYTLFSASSRTAMVSWHSGGRNPHPDNVMGTFLKCVRSLKFMVMLDEIVENSF